MRVIASSPSEIIRAQTGVVIDPFRFQPVMVAAPLGVMALAALLGRVAGVKAYRTDVAYGLAPCHEIARSPCFVTPERRRCSWLSRALRELDGGAADSAAIPESRLAEIDGEQMFAVGFDKLAAFEYTVVDAATGASEEEMKAAKQRDQVPNGSACTTSRVALTGFMLPLVVENGLARKLIMMRDITTCCFGNVPNMNEYVIVTDEGARGMKALQDVPVVLTGVFRIKEIYEGGYLTSIFQMDGEKFLGPKK